MGARSMYRHMDVCIYTAGIEVYGRKLLVMSRQEKGKAGRFVLEERREYAKGREGLKGRIAAAGCSKHGSMLAKRGCRGVFTWHVMFSMAGMALSHCLQQAGRRVPVQTLSNGAWGLWGVACKSGITWERRTAQRNSGRQAAGEHRPMLVA